MRQRAQPPLFLVQKRWRKKQRRIARVKRELARRRCAHMKMLLRMAGGGSIPAYELDAPKHFALLRSSSHDQLVSFLRTLVEMTLIRGRVVCIDFRPVVRFYSDGTLLFYSELQRILARKPGSVKCRLPHDAVARQVLCHLGILKKLGHPKDIPSDRDDVLHWDVISGTVADARELGQTIEKLPKLNKSQMGQLFRSVTEALTNVTQHAYGEPRQDGTGLTTDRGWWMFVRQEPDQLTVMFCDLGLGVSYTVPRSQKHAGWFNKRLSAVLQAVGVHSHQDGETIQVAVEEKRSRFREEHRGNGFGNMLETIKTNGSGRLTIFSNRGAYNFALENGQEEQKAYNYHGSIYGTLVGWHIALTKEMP